MDNLPISPLLSKKDAANLLAISEVTLMREVKRKHIAAIRIGRLVHFDPRDIVAYIEARKSPQEGRAK